MHTCHLRSHLGLQGTSINCLIDNLGSPEPLESHCHSQQDLYFSRCPTDIFGVTALALRDLGLRDAEDLEIFKAAKAQGVIFMTKDSDFVDLVDRLGAPP